MIVNSPKVLDRLIGWIPIGLVVVLASLAAFWWAFGQTLVVRMYSGNFLSFLVVPEPWLQRYTPGQMFVLMRKALLGSTFASVALAGGIAWLRGLKNPETIYRVRALISILAASAICTACLFWDGEDSEGYPLAKAVTFTTDPPFLHRLLFVWVVKLVMLSGASLNLSYFVGMGIAVLLAMTALFKFAELYVARERTYLAPLLMAGIVAPTFNYYTFYDMGIVAVFAAGLALLFTRQWVAYLLLVGVGTLNHEIVLFLMLVAILIVYGEKGWLWLVAGQFAIYGAIRAILFQVLPVPRAWFAGNAWVNMEFLVVRPYRMTETALLLLWFAAAIYTGWRSATMELKLSVAILPMLVGSTLLVGQLDEARQFDAFIPVAVVLLLRALAPREEAAVPVTD